MFVKLVSFSRKLISRRNIIKITIISILFVGLSVFISDVWVKKYSKNKLFSSSSKISKNKVGLLLGTSKFVANGNQNLYYKYRINAAVELLKSKKIEFIIVSGDNGRKGYDEPSLMRDDLIRRGIPENKIFLDYAGFRTLDSMIRAKEVFGQNQITVISQKFHNERAIFIGEMKGITTIGFNAKDVSRYYGFKTHIREKLARVKMILDLVTNKRSKFLGKKIVIN